MKQILDHGYLKLIETWGSDERIVEAARMSTQKGFLGWGPRCGLCAGEVEQSGDHPDVFRCKSSTCNWVGAGKSGDEKLLRYLYENKHSTPFEMAGLTIEVQAPILVFREWQRHRTQGYSEMSARYEPLPDMNYIPSIERIMINAGGKNKQAGTVRGAGELDINTAEAFQAGLERQYANDEEFYQAYLKAGVPKELARCVLPVGRYSRMRATANLRNWLLFLTLRMDKAAQWEIRQYANAVGELVAEHFPRTWALFAEGL